MSDSPLASPTAERPGSPSPWVSPSLAISACPPLDRSVSTASSVSSVSGRSSSSRLSDSGIPGRRRGYMRPEGTKFADSARNRESVQNLGTIAHLQYYFARTGLLDGKGAQLAKTRKSAGSASELSASGLGDNMSPISFPSDKDATFDGSELLLGDSQIGDGLVESPIDQDDNVSSWCDYQEPMMLPPTVSTYKNTPVYVPPPPDMAVLRRELREAMDDARQLLKELDKHEANAAQKDGATTADAAVETESQGWYEIQGLHFLDIVTLAIRAAKNYYTAHEQPQRLYSIKSERQIRKELYEVLDMLKRMATRNFAGGVKTHEREAILAWASAIGKLLDTEEERERVELEEREKWSWREGDWSGKERDRELLFLRSFDPNPEELPAWIEPADGDESPTPFLQSLQNGLRLVHLHNALVKKSRRQFEEIKQYHTDTAKPYRCADNLRFWIKAAQLRWDVKLELDVMAVVLGADAAAWRKFDEALLKWCKGVREEIIAEWQEHRKASLSKTPTLRTSFAA